MWVQLEIALTAGKNKINEEKKNILNTVVHVSKVLVTLFRVHVNSCWNQAQPCGRYKSWHMNHFRNGFRRCHGDEPSDQMTHSNIFVDILLQRDCRRDATLSLSLSLLLCLCFSQTILIFDHRVWSESCRRVDKPFHPPSSQLELESL